MAAKVITMRGMLVPDRMVAYLAESARVLAEAERVKDNLERLPPAEWVERLRDVNARMRDLRLRMEAEAERGG